MANRCRNCFQIHPKGAQSCEEATRLIDIRVEEFRAELQEHRESCVGCPDDKQHVLNLRSLREKEQQPERYSGRRV